MRSKILFSESKTAIPQQAGSTALASLRTNKLAASVVANLKMQAQQAAKEPSAALNDSDNDSSEAREGHGQLHDNLLGGPGGVLCLRL